MGDLSEFSLPYRLFLKGYRWRKIDPIPFSPLRKPLEQSNVALVSTAGFVMPDQEPFDKEMAGGDFTFREIPATADASTLTESHRSEVFDHSGIESDPNLAFPLDRVQDLREQGRIGAVNFRHFSFMGSITAPGRLIERSAPECAARLVADEVDVALLIPV